MSKVISASAGTDNGRSTAQDVNNRHYRQYHYDDGSSERYYGGSRSWRNNNPGNIKYGQYAINKGAVGTDGTFAIFPDYQTGREAKKDLITDTGRYRNLTINKMISVYAPAVENNVKAYQDAIKQLTGLDMKRKMNSLNEKEVEKLLDAMEHFEYFKAGSKEASKEASKKFDKKTTSQLDGADTNSQADASHIAKDSMVKVAVSEKTGNDCERNSRREAAGYDASI